MTHVIIDTSHLAYAALYSVGDLAIGDVATGVLFQFLSRILQVGCKYKTNSILFAFDTPTSSGVRRKFYPDYKVKRGAKHDDPEKQVAIASMYQQLDMLRTEILPQLGFTNIYRVDGFESDDIIASLVGVDIPNAGARLPLGVNDTDKFCIVSNDGDLYQVLGKNNRVFMLNLASQKTYTHKDFVEEYGIDPVQWSLVKSIAGCNTDEVEGIAGVGETTAVKFIKKELPTHHKTYTAITNGTDIINRNTYLVRLPHRDFPWDMLEVKSNVFNGRGSYFKEMCNTYGFHTFLSPEALSEWKQLFTGKFVGMPSKPLGAPLGRVSAPKRLSGALGL